LTGVLGAWPELDVLILQQIGRRSGRLPIALLPSDASTLGRYLDASAADRRREAALALGRTETAPAIPQLLVKLSDESPAVRDAAHWALKAITGLQFKGDVKRWTEWYASEEAWWNGRGRDLVKTLSSQPPEKTAAVTRELAAHRAFREQVSTELVPLLDTAPWQSGRAAVLCVLASLRSARAVPLLVERLDAAEGTYRVELVAALKAITGESRGPEPGAWDDWRP
jgi:HEAT repeat protein